MRRAGATVPSEFAGKIDESVLKKTIDYETEKTRFSFISSIFSNIITIIFIFGGLLNIYNSWIASLNLSFIVSGWLFFLLLAYGSEFLSIPFSLYHTFKIENKYGFNAMTSRLWVSDFIKTLLISTVMLSLVTFAGFWLIQWSPHYWWFWVWGFLFIFSIFILYISPYIIEPLFNKFTPIEDESLKERILKLTNKAGIHASRILRIDASKRSKHTNAYFTGIGKTKRIVLYDTLLASMSQTEILSVLAHEIGHWKKKHMLKMIIAFEVFSFIALYLSFKIIQSDFLVTLFHVSSNTLYAKFIILAFLTDILSLLFTPCVSYFMRRHERLADRASYELTKDPESMASALIKLSKENLTNLYPHPLYVTLYYSHPPILERIRYLKGFSH
ncbi:MAG: M48 family peptidase [Candidatus Brocadia sp. AMX2]|uniref:Zn-dependent protease with chaperone function n=1 Tax=Candidatus Brocadia sinica JPN1 TaxID=1197129 RepID=A0ABQ0K1R4_9BACT|nr:MULTISPECIES: M48 family metallopeptidase [Brocadia]MBC6933503.1 M48 family peptidase [Candidatus Brocadia sp.]MBL1170272.1 M48 family peptidase [Candidatus Brocadia sp. AMX1]MCK6469549.1 M48 family metallopeptidase [Candidatus Brocadia sinica]KAA0242364.1 MAG: M48 family peptidase [Candidatus Brocadia sp. AMX2]MCE7868370.1 M48 family peptidase [Candidatus Brocadia sp. AMX2]